MSALRILPGLIAALAVLPICDSTFACGTAADRIVARVSIDALPAPLRLFFNRHLDGVVERAIEPGGFWRRDPRYRSRESWHCVMLDAAAEDHSYEARRQSALAFPIGKTEARSLFRKHGIKFGGELPWRLKELTSELQAAFESGDADDIVKCAGYVIHFSTDAASPFSATRDPRGEETGSVTFGHFEVGDALFAHQDAAHRIGGELIRRNAERYRESIDPATIRFELAVDIENVTLQALVRSLQDLEALQHADREALARMGITDGQAFLARADEYYELVDDRCGAHCVENLRRGAALATTLLVHAWTEAGSPDLPGREAAPLPDPATPSPASTMSSPSPASATSGPSPAPATSGPSPAPATSSPSPAPTPSPGEAPAASITFVASKNSKIYHRSDCKHAERISQENRVEFPTAAAAAASGRRPCRTCLPDHG